MDSSFLELEMIGPWKVWRRSKGLWIYNTLFWPLARTFGFWLFPSWPLAKTDDSSTIDPFLFETSVGFGGFPAFGRSGA